MPSGATHDRITWLSFPVVLGTTLLMTRNLGLGACVSGGFLFSGLMFGPDLDIHSIQFKRWGYLRWVWLPYQRKVRHRSWISHGPVIGTCIRVLYLASWLLLVVGAGVGLAIALGWMNWADLLLLARNPTRTQQHLPAMGALFWGLELGALSHYASDSLSSAWGRLIRPFRRQTSRRR